RYSLHLLDSLALYDRINNIVIHRHSLASFIALIDACLAICDRRLVLRHYFRFFFGPMRPALRESFFDCVWRLSFGTGPGFMRPRSFFAMNIASLFDIIKARLSVGHFAECARLLRYVIAILSKHIGVKSRKLQ